jgi:uncharacterized membrane protein
MNDTHNNPMQPQAASGLVTYTHLIYALHSTAVLTGLLTSGTVAGRFVFSLPSIIAVIMNYARRHEARGSYLDSHFSWQIRTFWLALLGLVIILLISAPLILLMGLGVLTAWVGFCLVGVWVIYRVARGWLALRAGRALPMAPA